MKTIVKNKMSTKLREFANWVKLPNLELHKLALSEITWENDLLIPVMEKYNDKLNVLLIDQNGEIYHELNQNMTFLPDGRNNCTCFNLHPSLSDKHEFVQSLINQGLIKAQENNVFSLMPEYFPTENISKLFLS